MAITQSYRIPIGMDVKRFSMWQRRATSLHDTVLTLPEARPSWALPILYEDDAVQAPIVMYPGTIVGMLNARDHSAGVGGPFLNQSRTVLVPAHAHASGYNLVYSAYDLATSKYGGTYDLDETLGETIVAATGASAAAIASTRPLGVVSEPIYGQQYYRRHHNLQQQHQVEVLSQGQMLRIPAITSEEMAIQPGDIVMVSASAGDHDPLGAPTASYPGRWAAWDESTVGHIPYIMGRCVGRHRIVSQSAANAGNLLLTDISNGNVNTGSLDQVEGYDDFAKNQTVPGLTLQGSGTLGIPTSLTFARSDASGDFYALDIALATFGI
jgi:hypothetical protein